MAIGMPAERGVLFEELARYPQAACSLGASALKQGDEELAQRLVAALGEVLLPGGANPWEGPSGEFWREALKRDPKPWLESILGGMGKERVKQSAYSLLIASAQHGAFECFDYLLSLGAARRSWKILESAYLSGGWRAAEKVKKPTEKEAALMMSYGASGYRHRDCKHTGDDLLWLSKFLDPAHRQDESWLRSLGMSQSPETLLACVREHERLKCSIDKASALPLACALAASRASEAALALVDMFALDPFSPAPGLTRLNVQAASGYQSHVEVKVSNLSLLEAALMGLNASLCKEMMRRGASMPSKQRLGAIWAEAASTPWLNKVAQKHAGPSESLRETLELEAALAKPDARVRRPQRGL